ncbi:MAG: hypothetical protein AAGF25_06435 [Pseudomonadota bacterium]
MRKLHHRVIFGFFALLFLQPVAVVQAQEKGLFYLPKADDARFQKISRVGNEQGWPFTVDEGLLSCIYAAGRPLVMFLVEDGLEADNVTPKLRSVTVSPDPFEAFLGNIGVNDLIADEGGNNKLRLELFSDFYEIGKRLCEQPRGSYLSPGEL